MYPHLLTAHQSSHRGSRRLSVWVCETCCVPEEYGTIYHKQSKTSVLALHTLTTLSPLSHHFVAVVPLLLFLAKVSRPSSEGGPAVGQQL